MSTPYRVAIAGLGTVGSGTVELLSRNAEIIARRAGRPIHVTAISARDRSKDRGFDVSRYHWYDDPAEMVTSAQCDAVVEVIGGEEGIARQVIDSALSKGRAVVTANKALLAHHGNELFYLAERCEAPLCFEAAVAGGIPIIKSLREGLAANTVTELAGILNGTCNYILTSMRDTGRSFDEVLKEAQELGYAEADPGFDVDGIDAGHKLTLLSALVFGARCNFKALEIEGIRKIEPIDIVYANELGYAIKLLGVARMTEDGLEQSIHPTLVHKSCAIAHVDGVLNAVMARGDAIGEFMATGPGAGREATASAVVADLIDLARGVRVPPLGVPVAALEDAPLAESAERLGKYYLRLKVIDKPGVIAGLTAALSAKGVSVEDMLQRGAVRNRPVDVVITTHSIRENELNDALKTISGMDTLAAPPRCLRVEKF